MVFELLTTIAVYLSTRWTRVNKSQALEVTQDIDVYEGLSYMIRVSAENEAGQGKPCEPIGPLLAKAPLGKSELAESLSVCT